LWPRRIRQRKVFSLKCMRSAGSVHSDSAWFAHSKTKPLNIPGAWHECGEMYKCKFSGFLYKVVEIVPLDVQVTVRSRKTLVVVLSLNSHASGRNSVLVRKNR